MPAAAVLLDASQNEAWRDRLAEARSELERARERRDAAETAVDRMRHSRHPRGAAREALFAERDEARAGAAEAERALEELFEQARRAGVPPGWLRAPDAELPAAPE
jgi:chromosome segregation ATPase